MAGADAALVDSDHPEVPSPPSPTDDASPRDAAVGDAPVTCTAPLEACGSACVDKQSSAQHCGRCDRACGSGSSCSAARCSPITLATGLDTATGLVVGVASVVVSTKDVLVRCGKDGCAQGPTRLWSTTGWSMIGGAIALSEDRSEVLSLAQATPPGDPETHLYRVAIDGSPPIVPTQVTTAATYHLNNSVSIAADAREYVIGSPYRNQRCFRAACTDVSLLSPNETPTSITLTPTHYAWTAVDTTGGATAQTCPRPPAGATDYAGATDCGTPLGLSPAITQSRSGYVSSHAGVIYWADWSISGGATGRVLACAATGCAGAPKVIASGEQVIDGLTVDATGAYWTNGTSGTVRACHDLALGCGTAAETLASGATSPGPIALDDTFVYYVARGASPTTGALLKVAK